MAEGAGAGEACAADPGTCSLSRRVAGAAGAGARVNHMRLVTFNVKRFHEGAAAVASCLRGLKASVVALQEVTSDGFAELTAAMPEYNGEFFGHVGNGAYGNAVLSLHPIVGQERVHLRGGSVVTWPKGTRTLAGCVADGSQAHRIVRGLLMCEVDIGDDEPLAVAATHLDHMSLAEREVQIAHVLEVLQPAERRLCVLMGDLNTLRRTDYADGEWACLEERAAERGWREPQDGGLEILERAGMVDCCAHASRELRTAPTGDPVMRIDHVVASSRFAAEWHVTCAEVAEHVACSDHHPLVVDVKRRTPSL